MKMLWQENHSLHHRFTGLVAAGLDVARMPPPEQPPTAVSRQLLWGCSLCGHGAERLDCQEPTSLLAPGATGWLAGACS